MAQNTKAPEESVAKSIIKPIVVLVVICVVCSALLAFLNSMTAPIIVENTRQETMSAYLSVMPEGTDGSTLTEVADLTTEGVEGAVRSPDGTVAVKAAAAGYGGKDLTIYIAFDAAGNVLNMQADASQQTTGIGSKTGAKSFTDGFVGWNASAQVESGKPVDAIAGATVSSKALFKAVNAAIDCYNNELAGGASNG